MKNFNKSLTIVSSLFLVVAAMSAAHANCLERYSDKIAENQVTITELSGRLENMKNAAKYVITVPFLAPVMYLTAAQKESLESKSAKLKRVQTLIADAEKGSGNELSSLRQKLKKDYSERDLAELVRKIDHEDSICAKGSLMTIKDISKNIDKGNFQL